MSQQPSRSFSSHCFKENNKDTFRKMCFLKKYAQHLIIYYYYTVDRMANICALVFGMWNKEPLSLLCSQVNIYEQAQQKSKLQHCRLLKLYRPPGALVLAGAGWVSWPVLLAPEGGHSFFQGSPGVGRLSSTLCLARLLTNLVSRLIVYLPRSTSPLSMQHVRVSLQTPDLFLVIASSPLCEPLWRAQKCLWWKHGGKTW